MIELVPAWGVNESGLIISVLVGSLLGGGGTMLVARLSGGTRRKEVTDR